MNVGNVAKRIIGSTTAAIAIVIAAGLTACSDPIEPVRITLDPQTTHQTIDSWAVYPRYWEHDKENNRFDRSYEAYADMISRYLVDEVGINGVRIEIWSGLENPEDHWIKFLRGENSYETDKLYRYEKVNDNDDPLVAAASGFQFSKFDHRLETMVLPMKRAMEARGERLHVNLNYVDFAFKSNAGSLSHARNPDEFAEFVLVYFQRLRDKYGIVPDSFELVLEPDNSDDWHGRELAQGLLAVRQRLELDGFRPEFIAPSASSMSGSIDYFDEMSRVPGALEALDVFAYHRYGVQRLEFVEEIHDRAARYGLKTAMLEKINAGIDELMEDLVVGHVSSWQQWAAAGRTEWGDRGVFYVNAQLGSDGAARVEMGATTIHLAQVFRHVRAGAVRIEATSSSPAVKPVAFINSDGRWAIVVRASEGGRSLSIGDIAPGDYLVRFVSDRNEIQPEYAVSVGQLSSLQLELPDAGTLALRSMK